MSEPPQESAGGESEEIDRASHSPHATIEPPRLKAEGAVGACTDSKVTTTQCPFTAMSSVAKQK